MGAMIPRFLVSWTERAERTHPPQPGTWIFLLVTTALMAASWVSLASVEQASALQWVEGAAIFGWLIHLVLWRYRRERQRLRDANNA